MAGTDLRIIIDAILKSTAIPTIEKQLDAIQKKYGKMDLGINVDTQQLSNLTKQVEIITKQMAGAKPLEVISKDSIQEGQKLYATLKDVKDEYSKLGSVKVTNETLNPITRELEGFSIVVTNADKNVEKLKFDLLHIADGDKINQMFTPTKLTQTDSIESKNNKMLQEAYKINDDLNKQKEDKDKAHYQALNINREIDYKNHENIMADNNKMLDSAYKENETINKRVEALDKAHYQALKANSEFDYQKNENEVADRNKMLDEAYKFNSEYDKKSESLDKAHYQALKMNRDIDYKNHEKNISDHNKLLDEAYKYNDNMNKSSEALDKAHYQALQQNADLDAKRSIAQSKLGTNVGTSPKFGLDFKEAQEYAKSIAGIDAELRSVGYSINSAGEKLQTLNIQTKEGGKYQKDWTATLNQATGQTHLFEKGLSDVAQRQLGIAEKFKTMAQSIPLWMIGMTGFMSTLHFFTEGIKYVNEFNATLTQISTAVNYSQAKVNELGKTFQQLGVIMGSTSKEISAGALEFYRQGLNDEQVLSRLKLTTEYAKISGLEFKQSAELLTAASTSMHTDITKVADVFTLLGKQHCPLVA